VAEFEEGLGFVGEMVFDTLRAGFVGLVDVYPLDGAAEARGFGIGSGAADGVVKD